MAYMKYLSNFIKLSSMVEVVVYVEVYFTFTASRIFILNSSVFGYSVGAMGRDGYIGFSSYFSSSFFSLTVILSS